MLYRDEQKGISSQLGQSAKRGLIGVLMLLGVASAGLGFPGTSIAIVEALTLDQSFTSPQNLGAIINECCRYVAQTFTAGLSGTIAGVSIDVEATGIFPLHIAIRTVKDGVPTRTVLGETTLSSGSAPLSQLITFPQVINIVAGAQYAIVVNYEGAPRPGQGQGGWAGASGDQYARGALYLSSLNGISWEEFLGADLHFQTYMNLGLPIDIKPDTLTNSINPQSQGTISVAILSAVDFDAAAEVDTASLTFGRTGDEASIAFCDSSPEDVNDDGFLDLVCHFTTALTGFQSGDTEGILKGETFAGVPMTGKDSVRIVP